MENSKLSIGKIDLAMDIKGAEHLHLVMTSALSEEFRQALQTLVDKHVAHMSPDDICIAKLNHVAESIKTLAPLRPMRME